MCSASTRDAVLTFSLYHVVRGASAGLDNILRHNVELQPLGTIDYGEEAGTTGIQMQAGDSLVVQVDTADAATFTVYGVTQRLAERQAVRQPT